MPDRRCSRRPHNSRLPVAVGYGPVIRCRLVWSHFYLDPQAQVAATSLGKEEVEDASADTLFLELEGDLLIAVVAVGNSEDLVGVGVLFCCYRVGPPDEVGLFYVFQFLPGLVESSERLVSK